MYVYNHRSIAPGLIVCFSPLFPGFAGTPGYLSPEVLRKDPYGRPVDIWACGKSAGGVTPHSNST